MAGTFSFPCPCCGGSLPCDDYPWHCCLAYDGCCVERGGTWTASNTSIEMPDLSGFEDWEAENITETVDWYNTNAINTYSASLDPASCAPYALFDVTGGQVEFDGVFSPVPGINMTATASGVDINGYALGSVLLQKSFTPVGCGSWTGFPDRAELAGPGIGIDVTPTGSMTLTATRGNCGYKASPPCCTYTSDLP